MAQLVTGLGQIEEGIKNQGGGNKKVRVMRSSDQTVAHSHGDSLSAIADVQLAEDIR